MIAPARTRRRGYTACLRGRHTPAPSPRDRLRALPAAPLSARALSQIKGTRALHRPGKFGPGRCPAPRKGAAPPLTPRQLGARDIFGSVSAHLGFFSCFSPLKPSARLKLGFARFCTLPIAVLPATLPKRFSASFLAAGTDYSGNGNR